MITTALATASAAAAAGTIWFAPPLIRRATQVGKLRRACKDTNTVCLTYDDGPGEHLTTTLLDLLNANNARATFFALGSRAQHHHAVLRRITDEGHQLGSHSFAHKNAWRAPVTATADIARGCELLAPFAGPHHAFRPPYGKATAATLAWTTRRKHPVRWWTIDSGDTSPELPSTDDIIAAIDRDRGGVVLLHDFDQQRSRERIAYVIDTTAAIIAWAKARNARLTTIQQLTDDPAR